MHTVRCKMQVSLYWGQQFEERDAKSHVFCFRVMHPLIRFFEQCCFFLLQYLFSLLDGGGKPKGIFTRMIVKIYDICFLTL